MGTPKERYQQSEIELLRARLRSLRRAVDETEDLLNRYITAEQALRESEERFRLLVDAVKDYAIFMLDIDGRILSWNSGAQRIKGLHLRAIGAGKFELGRPQPRRFEQLRFALG